MESLRELLALAVRIEENGRRLYEHAWETAAGEELRALFRYLADEESAHAATFEKLRREAPETEPDAADALETHEHLEFLRAFIHHVIFSPAVQDELPRLRAVPEVVAFALARESESILFYEELKRLFSPAIRSLLDQIIREETRHYLKLFRLQEKLKA